MEFFIRMNGKIKKVDILYTEKLDILKALIHPIRLKILNALLIKPNYPKALAKELNIQPQKLLYHFKKLEELGLVEKIKEERISGSVARFYKVSPKLFVFNFLGDSIFETAIEIPINTPIISGWVAHFVQDSKLNAKIVVGSPDLHGPFSARARDAWSAAELSLYLGRFISALDKNPIVLDTAVDADIIKENLIQHNGGYGIKLQGYHSVLLGNNNSRIIQNKIMDNNGHGIALGFDIYELSIYRNEIRGNSGDGIYATNFTQSMNIENNLIPMYSVNSSVFLSGLLHFLLHAKRCPAHRQDRHKCE